MSAGQRIKRALARFDALHPAEISLGLARVRVLLAKLGDPHDHLPPTIHVAGTNGKGSTIAMLGSMAEAAGLSAHIHTSPHLVHLNERYVLGGNPITDPALADLLEDVEAVNDGTSITQFELLTAVMFLAFARSPADIALIEVGLGGEFDASNVLAKPALCLISPIAHDHADYLGTDMADIARAKAGIIKPGVPVISARQDDIARDVIEQACHRAKASLQCAGEKFHVRVEDGRLVYEDETQLLDLPLPRLKGAHQVENAGLAVAAALHMGWDHTAIAQGLETVHWPGRFDVLHRGALAKRAIDKGAQIIVDGAHNPHAAQALASSLNEMQKHDPRPLVLIAGLQNTKDAVEFFKAFSALAPLVICIPVKHAPHPMTPEDMQVAARHANLEARIAPAFEAAFKSALSTARDPRIVVCGSLYLAGEVLALNA